MPDLPRTRFASCPLIVLGLAISVGILMGHYFSSQSRSILIFSVAIGLSLALLSILLVSKKKLRRASVFLVAALLCSGIVLSLIDRRTIAPNRISQMYDQGLMAPGEPVELTGTLQGQPEPAPDS